ncbi:glycosyltransferase family 2 protein [Brumimicrobium mesophilum]|uniref:glycosyltransferase family 2 protein n=1 Tax=Brumimicrobium mesophilum TaxID=392717 RepID=UPI000D144DB0|nr:glycosyltransferase family 2 protein [Brumimicrobium mesophilum]
METKNNKAIDISVIVPIYNEQEIITELYDRIQKTVSQISENYELIFVNDGSKDHSLLELLKLTEIDNRVFYINFSRNFGHQIAVTAGIDKCSGEVVVIIDGDLQDPPELIMELYDKHKEGFEIVYARRRERKGESFFKKTTAKMFYRTLRKITSIDIPLDTGDFRLIDKQVVHYLKQMPEQNKFLRGQIAWLGFRQSEVLFDRDERRFGKTGYSLGKMVKFAMDGITSFSDKPLQLVTKIGFSISFLSFIIILYAIYSHYILNQTITGWTSLIISSMFIGGVQLISIGIIGEYISRINKNVMNRPLYIIEKSNFK